MSVYYIGVDPGWKNFAWAALGRDGSLVTGVTCPKESKEPSAVNELSFYLRNRAVPASVIGAVMERFVYYNGVHNPNSEQILMVTGQVQQYLYSEYGIVPKMVKAYDWKNRLCKVLYRKGFRNPSDSFDKVFSLAAARFIFPDYEFKTDHEADAACMAYIASIMNGEE